jgi:hypothetical protein
MKSDFDFQRFVDIPDPFAEPADAIAPPARELPAGYGPTRSDVRAARMAALGGAFAYEVLGLILLRTRPDLASMPVWSLALGLMIPAAAAGIALGAATRTGDEGLGEPVRRLAALAIGTPVLFAAATLLVAPNSLASYTHDDAFWQQARSCIVTSAMLGAGPLLLGAWAVRRAFVAAARWRAAALGVACGALAAAMLSLVCPNGNAFHVLVGHGTMMIVMGLAGAIVGRWIAA